jgi:hypothetical protein
VEKAGFAEFPTADRLLDVEDSKVEFEIADICSVVAAR